MMLKPLYLVYSLLFSPYILADVYKCIGESGKTLYQQAPCAGTILPIDDWQPAPTPPIAKAPHGSEVKLPAVHHRAQRSETAKNLFKSFHPCPSTGEASGPCPGYVVDHIMPLACGGADDPANMQWQTVMQGKAKDRWERRGCESTSLAKSNYLRPNPRVQIGPRGGRYIISPSGHKHYLHQGGQQGLH